MADKESVASARKAVGSAYKDWLKETYETQLSEMGSKKTRDQLPAIGPSGAWADVGIQSKPLAWLVEFVKDDQGRWTAGLPPSNYPHRLGGSFNSKSPLQGLLSRVIPVVRTSNEPRRAEPHPYWEWALAFVFPGRPAFQTRGSSGGVIEFDPQTGRLWSPVDEAQIDQPYVDAGLFSLVPADEAWSDTVALTYGEATRALADFIMIASVEPPEIPDEEDVLAPNGEPGDDQTPRNPNPNQSQMMSYRVERSSPELRELMTRVSDALQNVGPDVTMVQNLQYYAYRRQRNFGSLEVFPQVATIKVYLKIDPQAVTLEPGFTRDVTGVQHFGNIGNLEVLIKSDADLERARPLIRSAYDEGA